MRTIIFILILPVLFSISIAGADTIIMAADRWCPVNCEPDSPRPGFMVEIAQQVFTKAGHTIEYRIVPWARAIEEANAGRINGIIGAFHGDAPDFIFPENELFLLSGNSFFVTSKSKWTYKDISSLSEIIIGAINGYDYGEEINSYINKYKGTKRVDLISGNHPLERNIQKLLNGRIDVLVESNVVFWRTASAMGVKDNIKSAGQASKPEKCYIAFSPSNIKSKEYAKILSDGVDMLRKSGQLKKILNAYEVDDWK